MRRPLLRICNSSDHARVDPIRKNARWWTLTRDDLRPLFEPRSHQTQVRLDFLTWFELAKKDTADFDRLLSRLGTSEEWKYVEPEVEIQVEHDNLAPTNETCAS